jgi:hypothetical protein
METEPVNALASAHQCAEVNHLGGILDAYGIVCAYGHLPVSWQTLATQLAVYLNSGYFADTRTKSLIDFDLTFLWKFISSNRLIQSSLI